MVPQLSQSLGHADTVLGSKRVSSESQVSWQSRCTETVSIRKFFHLKIRFQSELLSKCCGDSSQLFHESRFLDLVNAPNAYDQLAHGRSPWAHVVFVSFRFRFGSSKMSSNPVLSRSLNLASMFHSRRRLALQGIHLTSLNDQSVLLTFDSLSFGGHRSNVPRALSRRRSPIDDITRTARRPSEQRAPGCATDRGRSTTGQVSLHPDFRRRRPPSPLGRQGVF